VSKGDFNRALEFMMRREWSGAGEARTAAR
jgi:hypothetical protein